LILSGALLRCRGAASVLVAAVAAGLLAVAVDLDAVLAAQGAWLEAVALLLAGVLEGQHLHLRMRKVVSALGWWH
jgi:hypothetical protein